jgi:hypothetical protein
MLGRMAAEDDPLAHKKRLRAAYVARENPGVSEEEVMTLIGLIGMDTNALLREAAILAKRKS